MDPSKLRRLSRALALGLLIGAAPAAAADYRSSEGWPRLAGDIKLGQVSGLALEEDGTVLLFHRGEKSWATAGSSVGETIAEAFKRAFAVIDDDDFIRAPALLRLNPDTGRVFDRLGAQQFVRPHGLSVGKDGTIWVTDVRLHQVLKLSRQGKVLFALGRRGEFGDATDRFDEPTDVAHLSDGRIVVADGYGNSRIMLFSPAGDFVKRWGRAGTDAGEFDTPHGLAVDAMDRIYVADRGNARVQVFDAEGELLNIFESQEIGRPWAVDIGPDGLLYVLDGGDQGEGGDRAGIVKMTLDGDVLERFGSYGYDHGQMVWPHDLVVGGNGAVYVGDVHDSMRAHKFVPTKEEAARISE